MCWCGKTLLFEASFPSGGLLSIVLHISLFSALSVLHYSVKILWSDWFSSLYFLGRSKFLELLPIPAHVKMQTPSQADKTRSLSFLPGSSTAFFFLDIWCAAKKGWELSTTATHSGDAVLCLLKAVTVFTNKQRIK